MNLYNQTPVFYSHALSSKLKKDIWFKMDCHQPTGSFKVRGVGQMCIEAAQAGSRQFVIASGGNAGMATAYAGYQLGIKTTVVIPKTTGQAVISKLEQLDANVIIYGDVWDESNAFAQKICSEENATNIHPFDHPAIRSGNATAIDECAEQIQEPDAIIVSVGGGGYFCGVIEGIERNNWKNTQIITAETHGAASMHKAILAQELITLDKIDTIATTLGAKRVAAKALEDALRHNVKSYAVSDAQAVDAMHLFLNETSCLVEPACGAALSAVYHNHPLIQSAKSILIMICGGSGMTLEKMNHYMELFSK